MALIVTDNSVRQINAALLSLEKKIGETNSEKAQDKQVVQMELKNIQYDFMAPLYQSGNSVSINTTGTWEGNARSATNAEHAITADNVEHADTATSADHATNANTADTATSADTATTATSANLSKTLDTVNGDKLQIGSGTAQNVTNAKHAATADNAANAEHASTADNVEHANTADTATNADHAATAEHAITADNGVPTYSTSDAGKNLAVNSSGNAVGWVKPQTIKFVDYKTDSLTFSSLTDQKKIELSNFGPEVTENNVLNFMTIYWNTIHIIAQADWSKSQGTGSSGMACALHSLNTGTGYAVIRCVYLV